MAESKKASPPRKLPLPKEFFRGSSTLGVKKFRVKISKTSKSSPRSDANLPTMEDCMTVLNFNDTSDSDQGSPNILSPRSFETSGGSISPRYMSPEIDDYPRPRSVSCARGLIEPHDMEAIKRRGSDPPRLEAFSLHSNSAVIFPPGTHITPVVLISPAPTPVWAYHTTQVNEVEYDASYGVDVQRQILIQRQIEREYQVQKQIEAEEQLRSLQHVPSETSDRQLPSFRQFMASVTAPDDNDNNTSDRSLEGSRMRSLEGSRMNSAENARMLISPRAIILSPTPSFTILPQFISVDPHTVPQIDQISPRLHRYEYDTIIPGTQFTSTPPHQIRFNSSPYEYESHSMPSNH